MEDSEATKRIKMYSYHIKDCMPCCCFIKNVMLLLLHKKCYVVESRIEKLSDISLPFHLELFFVTLSPYSVSVGSDSYFLLN